ncbi:hypothetical protein [Streptomyces olivoreticuli]|uniref:hypothetical protein n=1 Tax=Streptomyces olivoreticuli TaxID=68246 RepID=UPI000E28220B|nr:hypothetical protein [Streptomyces olivoreticuli]
MTLNAADAVAAIRAEYGPDEHQAVEVYGDVIDALEEAGFPAYVETRGGLAVCAFTPDGSLLTVASEDALPWDRDKLAGWHLAHTAEDEPGTPWRCIVHDGAAAGHDTGAGEGFEAVVAAAVTHLKTCPRRSAEPGVRLRELAGSNGASALLAESRPKLPSGAPDPASTLAHGVRCTGCSSLQVALTARGWANCRTCGLGQEAGATVLCRDWCEECEAAAL